jgi:hypothetical protein
MKLDAHLDDSHIFDVENDTVIQFWFTKYIIHLPFCLGRRNDRLNEFVMLIYIYNNAMRSCNERATLHCVESYLYLLGHKVTGNYCTHVIGCTRWWFTHIWCGKRYRYSILNYKIYNSLPLAAKQVRKPLQNSYI